MKKTLIIGMLLICNIILGVLITLNKKNLNQRIKSMQNSSMEICKDEITTQFIKTIKYEQLNHKISEPVKHRLSNLFNNVNSEILLFRVDFPYCENCVFPTLDKLAEYSSTLGSENIVILTSFPSTDYATPFMNYIEKYNFKIINILHNDFYLENDFIGSYLFTIDESFYSKNLYFPKSCNLFILEGYLNHVISINYNIP